ncbi:formyltransferase family protein [Flavobacterium cerinum]|uniref:Formyl transferase n=1 Tax=Flavobacterium cerinum TaxID=2502784 RepID=A0A444HDP3_9FLAO|nr:formyltransferase family protein [Flavobacterium cerinum]RWX02380.1 formyl transferase [Flavobacterium cerinum]
MRIAYIGSVFFSAKALEKLISIKADVVGVVTKMESAFNSDFFDLSSIAQFNDIPYHYTSNINSPETVNWIKELNPDVVFCFGWSNLIKKEVLDISRLGVIGYHPTLLPYNKGRHPLIWAKVLGLEKSGSTFFFMDEGADTGDILSQKEFVINFEDDANVLYNRLIENALIQIEEFCSQLENGDYTRIQQDTTKGNSWRKRGKKDGIIDFRMNSSVICNLTRALTKPYVGAHIEYNGTDIKIWGVEVSEYDTTNDNIEPGKVLSILENKIEVKTGDSAIWLVNHEFKELPQVGTYII